MSEFYAPPVRDLGDPATDPPLTVRVRAGAADQHARLFDRDAARAVKMSRPNVWGEEWLVVGGSDEWFGVHLHGSDVRTWPVVPAYAVSAPWTRAAAQPAPPTCRHCGEAVSQPPATVNGKRLPLWHTAEMRVYCEPYDGVRQAEQAEPAHERGDLDVEAFRG